MQIIERDRMTQERSPNMVGLEWLAPFLLRDAEQDRHALIVMCQELVKIIKQERTK